MGRLTNEADIGDSVVGIFLLGLVGYAHSGTNGTPAEAEAMMHRLSF